MHVTEGVLFLLTKAGLGEDRNSPPRVLGLECLSHLLNTHRTDVATLFAFFFAAFLGSRCGSGGFKNLASLVRSGQEVFDTSWVGSGWGSSRVGSGQDVFDISRVESGWVGSGPVGSGPVRSGRVGSGRV